ncbi:hypothetical protein DFJ77DRAFT_508444 [Powellomyces hirtus]|nr:hypothetical protein DFJ77DRAFT_508444 [Powellomyces hirtus]
MHCLLRTQRSGAAVIAARCTRPTLNSSSSIQVLSRLEYTAAQGPPQAPGFARGKGRVVYNGKKLYGGDRNDVGPRENTIYGNLNDVGPSGNRMYGDRNDRHDRYDRAPRFDRAPKRNERRERPKAVEDPFDEVVRGPPRKVYPPDFAGFEKGLKEGDRVGAWLKFQDLIFDETERAQLKLSHFEDLMNLLVSHRPPKIDYALQVFGMMKEQGFLPTTDMYNILMTGYARLGDLEGCRNVLRKLAAQGLAPNMHTYNLFMKMYVNIGQFDAAVKFFDRMINEGVAPDVTSFNVLMGGAADDGRAEMVWKYYQDMLDLTYEPNERTFSILIKMHVRHGDLEMAEKWFADKKARGLQPDAYDYSTIMGGFAKKAQLEKVKEYFEKLVEDKLEPDSHTFNSVIHAQTNLGDLDGAIKTVDDMVKTYKLQPDAVMYHTLAHAFCNGGRPLEAEQLIAAMKRAHPKHAKQHLPGLYRSIITAYAKTLNVADATRVLLQSETDGHPVSRVGYNIVLEAAAKAFQTDVLEDLWSRLRYSPQLSAANYATNGPNEITYATVIEGFIVVNNTKRAMELYHDMLRQDRMEPSFEICSALIRALIRAREWKNAAFVLSRMRAGAGKGSEDRPLGKSFDDASDQFTKLLIETGQELENAAMVAESTPDTLADETMVKQQCDIVLALYKELMFASANKTATSSPLNPEVFRFAMEAHRQRRDPFNMVVVFVALQQHAASTQTQIPPQAIATLLLGVRHLAQLKTARAAIEMLTTQNQKPSALQKQFTLNRPAYIHLLHLEARCAMPDHMVGTVVDMRNEGHELTSREYVDLLRTFADAIDGAVKSNGYEWKKQLTNARAAFMAFVKDMQPHLLEREDEDGTDFENDVDELSGFKPVRGARSKGDFGKQMSALIP